ncbi:MAG TPA: metal ABC transporter permease, partial [Brevundimonas sp.]|nr:metal ABC transporter permease [Brevundimonas sp.]
MDGAVADTPADTPSTWKALADLFGVVGRSGAPQLRLRITAALTLTLLGKALGVAAPVLLGIAVNELAAGQGAAVAVGWG